MVPEPAAETAGSFASVVGSSFEAALSTAGGVPTFAGALPTASVPTPRSAMAANELQGGMITSYFVPPKAYILLYLAPAHYI